MLWPMGNLLPGSALFATLEGAVLTADTHRIAQIAAELIAMANESQDGQVGSRLLEVSYDLLRVAFPELPDRESFRQASAVRVLN